MNRGAAHTFVLLPPLQHNAFIQFSDTADLGLDYMEDKIYNALYQLRIAGYLETSQSRGCWIVSAKGRKYLNYLARELGHC